MSDSVGEGDGVRLSCIVSLWQMWIFNVCVIIVFFLMIRRPPRSTQSRSSAASDVYKRQGLTVSQFKYQTGPVKVAVVRDNKITKCFKTSEWTVSYTHLRAHETVLDIVCRLLLEKKKYSLNTFNHIILYTMNLTYNLLHVLILDIHSTPT